MDTADPGAPVPDGAGRADTAQGAAAFDDLPGGFTEASVDDEVSALIDDCTGGDAGAGGPSSPG